LIPFINLNYKLNAIMVCRPLCSIYYIIIPVCQSGLLVPVTIYYLRLVGFIPGFLLSQ